MMILRKLHFADLGDRCKMNIYSFYLQTSPLIQLRTVFWGPNLSSRQSLIQDPPRRQVRRAEAFSRRHNRDIAYPTYERLRRSTISCKVSPNLTLAGVEIDRPFDLKDPRRFPVTTGAEYGCGDDGMRVAIVATSSADKDSKLEVLYTGRYASKLRGLHDIEGDYQFIPTATILHSDGIQSEETYKELAIITNYQLKPGFAMEKNRVARAKNK